MLRYGKGTSARFGFAGRSMAVTVAVSLPAAVLFWFGGLEGAAAHPGGTDGSGCHVCRTNCTERYGIRASGRTATAH